MSTVLPHCPQPSEDSSTLITEDTSLPGLFLDVWRDEFSQFHCEGKRYFRMDFGNGSRLRGLLLIETYLPYFPMSAWGRARHYISVIQIAVSVEDKKLLHILVHSGFLFQNGAVVSGDVKISQSNAWRRNFLNFIAISEGVPADEEKEQNEARA